MTIHLDLSQLVQDPRRSGIQRAERELIRHWPGPAPLKPCRFDPASGDMHELPDEVLATLCAEAAPGASDGGIADERGRLAPYLRAGRPVARSGLRLLCAELFLDAGRAGYYRRLSGHPGAAAFWLVYDFLPWLHPDWFGAGAANGVMPYLRAMAEVPHIAFISHKTRADFATRVLRRPFDGPVIPMGGDGLGLERQTFDPARRDFVMLGTIEPRKNAAAAMRAFQLLWREGIEAGLTMVGAVAPDAMEEQALLRELAGHTGFRHLQNLPDAGVRVALSGARAMLFPSEGEGYGIPPMEALHAGIPAIVSAQLPALHGLPALGQVRLPATDPAGIAAAVRALLDDGAARHLWQEAARLQVPTWREFALAIAAWVQR